MPQYDKLTAFVQEDTIEDIAELASDLGVDYHALVQVAIERVLKDSASPLSYRVLLLEARRADQQVHSVLG